MKIGLLISEFHNEITHALKENALATFQTKGISLEDCEIISVPGAFELPTIAMRGAREKRWDVILCFGCVIQGETRHFDYVCAETARGLMQVGLETGIPALFEVITAKNKEQAQVRAGLENKTSGTAPLSEKPPLNKGIAGAEAAIAMLSLNDKWNCEK